MDGGGNHLGHFLLPPRAFSCVVHHLSDLFNGQVQPLGRAQHFTDQPALAVEKTVEAAGQVA
ncbi:hypothetical protein D3C81_1478760 [compost metagenome]